MVLKVNRPLYIVTDSKYLILAFQKIRDGKSGWADVQNGDILQLFADACRTRRTPGSGRTSELTTMASGFSWRKQTSRPSSSRSQVNDPDPAAALGHDTFGSQP